MRNRQYTRAQRAPRATERRQASRSYQLSTLEWSQRHGSLDRGALRAVNDTDHLVFVCPNPSCSAELRGGVGIGYEGYRVDRLTGLPAAHLFRLDSPCCEQRDFFKIAVDEIGKYGTPKVENPHDWRRDGIVKERETTADEHPLMERLHLILPGVDDGTG